MPHYCVDGAVSFAFAAYTSPNLSSPSPLPSPSLFPLPMDDTQQVRRRAHEWHRRCTPTWRLGLVGLDVLYPLHSEKGERNGLPPQVLQLRRAVVVTPASHHSWAHQIVLVHDGRNSSPSLPWNHLLSNSRTAALQRNHDHSACVYVRYASCPRRVRLSRSESSSYMYTSQ